MTDKEFAKIFYTEEGDQIVVLICHNEDEAAAEVSVMVKDPRLLLDISRTFYLFPLDKDGLVRARSFFEEMDEAEARRIAKLTFNLSDLFDDKKTNYL